jgi:hypothetical protein
MAGGKNTSDADRGYLKDIKPGTTWEQFKKKHPDAGITERGFNLLKPPAGSGRNERPKYRRTYRGVERTERAIKKGGIVRSTSADQDVAGKYLKRNDGGIALKTRTF